MKLVQFENGISDSADFLFFIVWGGVHKPGDERLVTLQDTKKYDTHLKLASTMSFCVYHCKIKLDDNIRHLISIKTLKFCKKFF